MTKQVLITVGTTQFDDLIKTTDTSQFITLLKSSGYTKIIYQIGKGKYLPKNGQHLTLTPQIVNYYNAADLIITHGGAGTLLQNLQNGKLMIAVANTTLLGNHQIQLIEQLVKEEYILGFGSVEQMREKFGAISEYIKFGPKKRYRPPECCIMNQIIFGNGKQKTS